MEAGRAFDAATSKALQEFSTPKALLRDEVTRNCSLPGFVDGFLLSLNPPPMLLAESP